MKKALLIFFLISGCQNNEADSPELLTKDAQQVGATSAVLEADIKEIGPVRPINFGFLWDVQEDITIAAASNKIISGSTSEPRTYSNKLDNLVPGTIYYYKSFAADAGYNHIYYGQMISFTTLP